VCLLNSIKGCLDDRFTQYLRRNGAMSADTKRANLSILKNEKAKAIRFSTLEAICKALDCQPGDILEYKSD
jgi:DNA-binding Xre family transcriptional regulator